MLPKRLRLPRAAFLPHTGAFRASSPHFSISCAKTAHSGGAAIVSKNVAKSAVDRHQLRRRILVVIRPWIQEGRSLIVRAKKGAPQLPFKALSKELEPLIERVCR